MEKNCWCPLLLCILYPLILSISFNYSHQPCRQQANSSYHHSTILTDNVKSAYIFLNESVYTNVQARVILLFSRT
uniref:Secreted protein n=1 Tax=Rhizophora mucronata TaxID=61149 RepID=A0A2P2IJ66_RHIMU